MFQQKNVVVVGSINTDMVVVTKSFPAPGKTLLADKFFTKLGGKGANRAVAASRLDDKVTLISKLGEDLFDNQALMDLSSSLLSNIDILTANQAEAKLLYAIEVYNEQTALLAARQSLKEVVVFATKAAVISVTRFGAQESAPN